MAAPALSKQASALSPTKQISLVEDHGGRGTFPFRATDDDGAPASTAVALAVKREASIEKTETERNARASARVSEGVGTRESVEERLRSTGYLPHGHELFMHGRAYTGKTTPPQAVWVSKKKPRDDHDAPTWLTATEYQDSAEVAAAKVRQLAELLRLSRRTVLYTGALA